MRRVSKQWLRTFGIPIALGAAFMIAACDRSAEPVDATEKQSAITAARKTPEEAAAARLSARSEHRATIDKLKAQAASMPDSADRRALEKQMRSEFDGYAAGVQGLAAHGNVDAIPLPPPRSPEKTASLLAKMGQYDLSKPSDAKEWARVKAQELGQ